MNTGYPGTDFLHLLDIFSVEQFKNEYGLTHAFDYGGNVIKLYSVDIEDAKYCHQPYSEAEDRLVLEEEDEGFKLVAIYGLWPKHAVTWLRGKANEDKWTLWNNGAHHTATLETWRKGWPDFREAKKATLVKTLTQIFAGSFRNTKCRPHILFFHRYENEISSNEEPINELLI